MFEAEFFDLVGPITPVLAQYGPSAPRFAALVLRKVALGPLEQLVERPDVYERAKAQIEERLKALFNELHRLTYVLAIKDGKYETVFMDEAKAMGAISAEEYGRIDNALIHFTWGSQCGPLTSIEALLGGLSLHNAWIESRTCTDFAAYLMTLIRDGSFGAKEESSPPSSTGSQEKASPPSSPASTNPNSHGAQRRRIGAVSITRVP